MIWVTSETKWNQIPDGRFVRDQSCVTSKSADLPLMPNIAKLKWVVPDNIITIHPPSSASVYHSGAIWNEGDKNWEIYLSWVLSAF